MGFALDPMSPADEVKEQLRKIRLQGELVGLNVSGFYCGGYTRANQFGLKGDYREMIQRLIRFFTVDMGVEVLLVPHVLGPPTDMESDITACAQVAKDAGEAVKGRLHVLPGNLNHHQVKWAIGQCDFFLGSRMHACIAAAPRRCRRWVWPTAASLRGFLAAWASRISLWTCAGSTRTRF